MQPLSETPLSKKIGWCSPFRAILGEVPSDRSSMDLSFYCSMSLLRRTSPYNLNIPARIHSLEIIPSSIEDKNHDTAQNQNRRLLVAVPSGPPGKWRVTRERHQYCSSICLIEHGTYHTNLSDDSGWLEIMRYEDLGRSEREKHGVIRGNVEEARDVTPSTWVFSRQYSVMKNARNNTPNCRFSFESWCLSERPLPCRRRRLTLRHLLAQSRSIVSMKLRLKLQI